MSSLTSLKIRAVMLVIAQRRLTGEIPQDAVVSFREMARISEEIECPLNEITFRRFSKTSLRKASLAIEALQSRTTR